MYDAVEREAQAPAAGPAPVRLGGCVLDAPVVLAPMAGYTHLPFRRLCRRHGAALVYTELTSVDALVRDVPASWRLLATDPAERPVVAHLYGHRPEVFAEAARRVEALGAFVAIDINAGCPVPKIVARGAGAGLLRDLRRLEAVVRSVRDAVRLPVTVKTRIGMQSGRGAPEDILRAVEAGGADAVAFHARVTAERHRGPADWAALARLKALARIPVFGNGGASTAARAVAMLTETGVDAVMIGRGALGNPWIFAQARARLAGQPAPPPTFAEREAALREHLEGLVALWRAAPRRRARRARGELDPESSAARQFRAQLIHYMAGLPGALEMRRGLNDIHTPADILAAVARVREVRKP